MPIESYDSVEPIAEEWTALVRRTGAPPWMRPGWVRVWMDAQGTGSLEVLAARGEGGVEGIVAVQRGGAVDSMPVWQSVVAEGDAAPAELARELFGRGGRRVLLLFGFPGTTGLEQALGAAKAAGYKTLVRPHLRSPFVTISGSWDDYLGARDRKYLKEIARRRRRLADQGELTFELRDGAEGLDALLEEGFAVEGSGWKLRQGTAVLSSPERVRYYTGLARWAAGEGMLRLAFLRLGTRAIAFDILVEDEQGLYNLKGGYDEAYAKFGPGVMLVHDSIAYCFDRGLQTYELLGDLEPWKLEWAHGVHERTELHAFAPDLAGRIGHAAFAYARPAARRARALLRR